LGEPVLDPQRTLCEDFTVNNSVIFEAAKGAREHLRRDSIKATLQLAESHTTAQKRANRERRPLAGYHIEQIAARARC
jgi:hypothetical protein